MCRTVTSVLSSVICGIQMMVRVVMTITLMLENLIRLVLQTLYNFVSFFLQLISLLPICCVFLVTSRLKCFMCGGGGPCPVNRGGGCDCLMSAIAIIILFFIFRATGILDKIFYSMGYAKAPTEVARFIPTPGVITECSRNDTEITEYELDYQTTPMSSIADSSGGELTGGGDTGTEMFSGDGDGGLGGGDNTPGGGEKGNGGGIEGGEVGPGGDSSPGGEGSPGNEKDPSGEGSLDGEAGPSGEGATGSESGTSKSSGPGSDESGPGGEDGPGDGGRAGGAESKAKNSANVDVKSDSIFRNSASHATTATWINTYYYPHRFRLVDDDATNFVTIIEESELADTVTPTVIRKRRTPDFKNIVSEIMTYLN